MGFGIKGFGPSLVCFQTTYDTQRCWADLLYQMRPNKPYLYLQSQSWLFDLQLEHT